MRVYEALLTWRAAQPRYCTPRVRDAEQAHHQRRDPGRDPPLVLLPPISPRPGLRRGPQLRELLLVQLAGASPSPLRRQGRLAADCQARSHWHADFVLTRSELATCLAST